MNCAMCGKKTGDIEAHVKMHHNLTMDQYRRRIHPRLLRAMKEDLAERQENLQTAQSQVASLISIMEVATAEYFARPGKIELLKADLKVIYILLTNS